MINEKLHLTTYKSWILLLLITTIHLGFNEYASVQFIVFVCIAIASYKVILSSLNIFLALLALLISSVFLSGLLNDHSDQLILKGIRSAVILLFLCIWSRKSASYALFTSTDIEHAIGKAVMISLFIGVLQLIDSLTFNNGMFDIPPYLYSLEYGTLLGAERESLSLINVFLRPTSFYSEPSAYAAIGLLGLASTQIKQNFKLKITSLLIIITSGSLSGMILTLLFLSSNDRKTYTKKFFSIFTVFFIVLLAAILFSDRIERAFFGEDLSTQIRIFEPIQIIFNMIQEGLYLGANTDKILNLSANKLPHVFDNWVFNQLMYYGIFGFLWIAIPSIWFRGSVLTLFFAACILNGDSVYYDRFFILFLLIQQQIKSKNDSDHINSYN